LALRISIHIGLHWETDAVLSLDRTQLDERRRLFWATYHLDRLLVITLGRPFSLEEQSIDVRFPDSPSTIESPVDSHSQEVANHLTKLDRLESEIKHVLYRHQKWTSLAFPRPDYALWIEDIKPRLEEWRASIPPLQNAHPESIYAFASWWDAIYNNTLMLLHRPTPVMPEPSIESLRVSFGAAVKLISCIRSLQRERRLDMAWLWAQRLFVAGLTLIYTIWNSDELRNAHAPEEIVNSAQTCATTLAVLTERFPAAAGCRDALETLVSATVKAFFAPRNPVFTGSNESQPSHSAIPGSVFQQPDLGISLDEMYSMFLGDTFRMGQGVSSTTGWFACVDDIAFDFRDPSTEWEVSLGNN